MVAYALLVGVPILGLLGILEKGKGITAPLSIAGDWNVQFDRAANCAAGIDHFRQPALNVSQSGPDALITWNDGRATIIPATINGSALTAPSLNATIAGKGVERVLQGNLNFDGCAPVAFRAVRYVPAKKRGE